jgi:hypothetical protein
MQTLYFVLLYLSEYLLQGLKIQEKMLGPKDSKVRKTKSLVKQIKFEIAMESKVWPLHRVVRLFNNYIIEEDLVSHLKPQKPTVVNTVDHKIFTKL